MRKVIDVNTTAHLYTIREFLPDMIRLNHGHIVSISSIAGTVGCPGLGEYCASKFGAFAIDECLRLEIKKMNKNIKTTCICPYFINTGMFDGVEGKWFLPILDQHWVVNRIVTAVRQNEPVVLMPWNANAFFILRGILPTFISDWLFKVCGAFESMDTFKGRQQ
jgi:all-trans-retinol dehydrogenase (NAD+)